MKLYLVRHAPAEALAADGRDQVRALTPEGRAGFDEIVRGLERLGLRFERLLHSPARRALETAELLAPLVDGELVVDERLYRAPEASFFAALAGDRLALVGHQPWLAQLAGWLASGEPPGSSAAPRLSLGKGGLIELEGEPRPGGMQFVQLLAPRTLRKLGRG